MPDPEIPCDQPRVSVLVSEAQLILAEKRTSMATMRTGIAVLALPFSMLGLLIATSKYYELGQVMHFFLPLIVICAVLFVFGSYLIYRAMRALIDQDRMLREIKKNCSEIRKYL